MVSRLIIFFCCFFSAGLFAETVYVSPAGDDRHSGRIESPFFSIKKAVDYLKFGGEIQLRGGVYYEKVVLTELNYKLTIKSFPGEVAYFDGSSLNFSNREHGIFQIDGATDVLIEGLFFLSSSASGVAICKGASNVSVEKNIFDGEFAWSPVKVCYNSRAYNIKIEGNYIDRKVPEICQWPGRYGCWAEMISISGAKGVSVVNNYIRSNPLGEGIDIKDGSSSIFVLNNLVTGTSSNAIYLDARGVLKNVSVCGNVVLNVDGNGIALATEAYDLGGADIYDVDICDNLVANVRRLGLGIGWFTNGRTKGVNSLISDVIVRNNRFIRTDGVLVGCSDKSSGHLVDVSGVKFVSNYFSANRFMKFCDRFGDCEPGVSNCSVSDFKDNLMDFY